MTTSLVNPERDQDRVADLFELFQKSGQIMFHQQQIIYQQLAVRLKGRGVLEAGCGTGLGTAIIDRYAGGITGTDKGERNVKFASVTYPWIPFRVWDLNQPTKLRSSVVVCVEALEHVANTGDALRHLVEAAHEEVWLSVPNGTNKPRPPKNPYHVCEYTPREMLDMIRTIGAFEVNVLHWNTFEPEDLGTLVDPLVYRIRKYHGNAAR